MRREQPASASLRAKPSPTRGFAPTGIELELHQSLPPGRTVPETSCERVGSTDIVEKLEFPLRSQFRRPLAVSMETSLGAQRSHRSSCVRSSLRPCCGNYPWRQHSARGNGIFAAPQFPTSSTISTRCCPSGSVQHARRTTESGRSGSMDHSRLRRAGSLRSAHRLTGHKELLAATQSA